jgi:WD40 repeat protein
MFQLRFLAVAAAAALFTGSAAPAFPAEKTLEQGHTGRVTALAFSPDGTLLAGVSLHEEGLKPGAVKVWDVGTGKARRTFGAGMSELAGVAFSADGKKLAVGGGELYHGGIAVCAVETGKVEWAKGDIATTSSVQVAFSPDGKTLATTGDAGTRKDPVVKLWDAASGEVRRELKGHRGGVGPVAFAPDGKTLATGGTDGSVILWDPSTGEVKRKLSLTGDEKAEVSVEALAYSPDGKTLVAGSRQGKILMLDAESGKTIRELGDGKGRPVSLAFSPDGKSVAGVIAGEKAVRIWAGQFWAAGEPWALEQEATVVAFSPDGKLLAVGCVNGAVRVKTR